MIRRWAEEIYVMNDYMDVSIFPVFKKAGKKRRGKSKPTDEVQKKLNEKNSQKYFDRMVHANFTRKDYALDLTYAKEPKDEREAQRRIRNFLRRAQRNLYKKKGVELKYIYVTERGLTTGRWHHHVFISGGVDRSELEDEWLKKDYAGRCNCDRLQFTKTGISDRVAYVSGRKEEKRAAEKTGYRRWTPSKNLKKPEKRRRETRLRKRDVEEIFKDSGNRFVWEKLYPGYFFAEAGEVYYNEVNGGIYIEARFYKKGAKILSGRL